MSTEFKQSDVSIKTKRGTGPGGQHKNKTDSCVVATHLPTGLSVTIDERNQHKNKRKALRELERKVKQHFADLQAADKKARRDKAIHDTKRIRSYNLNSGIVKDHRTGKTASVKDILDKGKLDLLK